MIRSSRWLWATWMATVCVAAVTRADSPQLDPGEALARYIAREEPEYAWRKIGERDLGGGRVHELEVTSQVWQGIPWKHMALVFEPPVLSHPQHVLLYVSGGKNGGGARDGDIALGLLLSQLCQARVVSLHQTPNQPLLGGKVEDDLISETWLRYLATGDETWPLLFPMVKGAMKSMDAVSAFLRENTGQDMKGYVISGASKRGWTSWLTPVVDQRIIATAPIVIDMLNFEKQMPHQLASWGEYSPQIRDYTSKGLVRTDDAPRTEREQRLWRMMDPYHYRDQLQLPKLLIVGTNDPYWVVDAMNLYWDDLQGPKYALQIPNAGHGLEGGRNQALTSLAVFFRMAASGRALPVIDWTCSYESDRMALKIRPAEQPVAVQLWETSAPTRDFRGSQWNARPLPKNGDDAWTAEISAPSSGKSAAFAELQFRAFDLVYSLTTLVYVHEAR